MSAPDDSATAVMDRIEEVSVEKAKETEEAWKGLGMHKRVLPVLVGTRTTPEELHSFVKAFQRGGDVAGLNKFMDALGNRSRLKASINNCMQEKFGEGIKLPSAQEIRARLKKQATSDKEESPPQNRDSSLKKPLQIEEVDVVRFLAEEIHRLREFLSDIFGPPEEPGARDYKRLKKELSPELLAALQLLIRREMGRFKPWLKDIGAEIARHVAAGVVLELGKRVDTVVQNGLSEGLSVDSSKGIDQRIIDQIVLSMLLTFGSFGKTIQEGLASMHKSTGESNDE